jgi:hypothetical protein
MNINDYVLRKTTKHRMDEDQHWAASERVAIAQGRLDLFFWQQRVRELFENLDRPSPQKASSRSAEMVTLGGDREQHEFS